MPDDIFRGNLSMEDRDRTKGRNWYDWSVQNWGTKWDAYSVEVEMDDGLLTLRFQTAWSQPGPWIKAFIKSLPEGVEVHHLYCCEGGPEFSGEVQYGDNGDIVSSSRYDYPESRVALRARAICEECWGYDPANLDEE